MSHVDFAKLSVYKTAEMSPGFLMWRASTLWRRAIEAVLKPRGLTHPQFVLLATIGYLSNNGQLASQAEVGRFAGLDPNTTSQVLRALQEKKFIERALLKDEKRKIPTLTRLGAKLLAEALPAVERADEAFFKSVNLTKENALSALQKLAKYEE